MTSMVIVVLQVCKENDLSWKTKLQAHNTMVVPMLGMWRSEWS